MKLKLVLNVACNSAVSALSAVKPVCCLGVSMVLASPAIADDSGAEDPAARRSYVLFQMDNDIVTGSDRNYTNGARIAWLRPIGEDKLNRLQRWLRELGGAGGSGPPSRLSALIDPATVRYDWGTGLTQLMFTPEDYNAPSAPPGQRPYTGWLGAEFSLHAKDARALSSVTLSVGTTGEDSFARESQEWVHSNISGSPIFQGWDSQVPDEVTVNLHLDHKRRLAALAGATSAWPVNLDGYLEWGAALGTFRTDAYAGALLRAGWHLPVQYVTPRIQLGSYAHELFAESVPHAASRWSVFGFLGARATAVAHDITIDGPVFREYAAAPGSEALVGELLAGIGARYGNLTVTFARTFRSREFDGQPEGHQFGSLLVSLGF